MKVFGSTRRLKNTTTENLAGSWTRTVTASNCGSLCRKSSCPGQLLACSRHCLLCRGPLELPALCSYQQAHNALKTRLARDTIKSTRICAHPFCFLASFHRGDTYEAFLPAFLLPIVRSSFICRGRSNCGIHPTS